MYSARVVRVVDGDTIDVDIEIGFNVNYLLEAIGVIESEKVTLALVDGNSSCLIHESDNEDCKYVVMPMRLSGP